MDYDLDARGDAATELAPISQGGSGEPVTLHQPATNGTFDPATDTTSAGRDAATHEGSGVEDNYSAFSQANGLVLAGDIKFLLSPLKADGSTMPKPIPDSWTLTKGDGRWAIKKVDTLAPAGTPVMFQLQLRR